MGAGLTTTTGFLQVSASVAYTHLTLPTKREVEIGVVGGAVKKKRGGRRGEEREVGKGMGERSRERK